MDLADEVDLAILELFDMTDEAGVCPAQARLMFRERIEIAYAWIESEADDWPEMVSIEVH